MNRVLFYLMVVLCIFVAASIIQRKFKSKKIDRLILFLYLLGNLSYTLLFRTPNAKTKVSLVWMRAFKRAIKLKYSFPETIRLLLTEGFPAGIRVVKTGPLKLTALNILLYMPMGFLLPLSFPNMKKRHVILLGFLFSLMTECIQGYFRLGMFELDDLVFNTLGTALGLLVYLLSHRKKKETA